MSIPTAADLKKNVPDVIPVYFEYENDVKTVKLWLELPEIIIQGVSSSGVLDVLEGLESADLEQTTVSCWRPTKFGEEAFWRISGDEFIRRHKLVEIKSRDQARDYV